MKLVDPPGWLPQFPALPRARDHWSGVVARIAPSALFLAGGTASAFHSTLLSGFRLLQTDPGDTRFNNYVLEHSYRWAIGWLTFHPISLWDQSMFFPTPNVAAFSDVLVGAAPIYWLFRGLRFAPDTALQLWMITVLALDFVAMDVFLRRCLGLKPVAIGIGAFLFAYAGPRVTQLGHQQLLPQFFTISGMYGIFRMLRPGRMTPTQGIYLFFLSAAAQLWAGYYLGWYLFLGVLAAGIAMLCSREDRARLMKPLATHKRTIATGAVLSLLAVAPMAYHYGVALRLVGPRHFVDVAGMIPPPQSWLYLGPDSWFYSWEPHVALFGTIPFEHEQRLGIGWITLAAALFGCRSLVRDRGRWARAGMLASLAIVFLITLYPGRITPWRLLFNMVPGANAIRAVSRIVFLMLIPLSIGLAWLIETRTRLGGALALGAICVLEQGHTTLAFDKLQARLDTSALGRLVDKNCLAFYYSPVFPPGTTWIPPPSKVQVDAIVVSMETGIPTINGHSGNMPRGWLDLLDNEILDEASYSRLRRALGRWIRTHGLDARRVCWITGGSGKPPTPDDAP
jgi:hypothetical protein